MSIELEIAAIKDRLNSLEAERSARSAAWSAAEDENADLTTDVHRLHDENQKLRELLTEARRLMLAVGESTDVTIQFPQHGWLKSVNEILNKPRFGTAGGRYCEAD